MDAAMDAVLEIFTWVGLGAGAILAGVALIAFLFDGTWMPVRAALDTTDGGRVARWFDEDGEVNEATLTHEQEHAIPAGDWAEVFIRQGSRNRLRLTRRSPAVRAFALLSAGLLSLGTIALIISTVLLFVRG